MANERWMWDATANLEALGAAEVALWVWEPEKDRLRLTGATRALGLGPLAPDCSSAALRALALPQDRALAEDILRFQPPGGEVAVRLRLRGGEPSIWRGTWLEDGVRAAGVVAPEVRFAAAGVDSLTGLCDRRSFITLARIGEDEFASLAPKSSSPGPDALRSALEQPLRIAGFDIHPTLAIGAVEATGGEDAPEATELLRRAELAVESARTQGRGTSAAYGRGLETDGLSRLALEGDLKGAMRRGELMPFYQPIVRLSTGALSGFEALVRWRHPRRGLLTPDQFLPSCEEMGLMNELGSMMMREAARQLATWRQHHHAAGELTVAVNLSTGEIDRSDLVAEVRAIRADTGLPPGALKLEVTEGDVMRDPDGAAVILCALRDAGAALALDDFGTGFSALSYLARLPFDTLKIDRYFVRTMASNEGSAKIVKSVVRLGQDLSMEVVAEGVENAMMAHQLLSLGCDYGQGFGYAPALSAQEAEVYLNESYVDGAAPVKARG